MSGEWERLEPLIRRAALDTYDDARRQWLEDRAQFWPADDAFLLTQVLPGGVIDVWLAAGRLRTIKELQPRVEAWARAVGCTHAVIEGAPRWGSAFPDFSERRGDDLWKRL